MALAIVYVFKTEIKDLIPRVRSLSAPGVNADFSERVVEASAAVQAAVQEAPAAPPGAPAQPAPRREPLDRIALMDRALSLAMENPKGAVIAAWGLVERELYEVQGRQVSAPFAEVVDEFPHLPAKIRDSLLSLRRIRDEVVHAVHRRPSPEAAVDYVESCEAVLRWLVDHQRFDPARA